jgi:hypothetical protein
MPTQGTACASTRGETDVGRTLIGTIWQVAAAALTVANTAVSASIASKQMELAKDYYQIAKNWRDWYNSGFKPLEDKEIEEVTAEAKVEPFYDIAIGRAIALGKNALKNKAYESIKCLSCYETGAQASRFKKYFEVSNRIIGSAASLGYRNERDRVTARELRRWTRKEQVISRGRDMASSNVSFASIAGKIFGSLAAQAGKAAGGYFGFLGYSQERMPTRYPGLLGYYPPEAREPEKQNIPTRRPIEENYGVLV